MQAFQFPEFPQIQFKSVPFVLITDVLVQTEPESALSI